MRISREETFGPALAISSFGHEDEAIAAANGSPYGLAAYCHSRDCGRVLRMSERLDFGVIGVDTGLVARANVPFGGVKASGYGSEGGAFGIEEYLAVKSVLLGCIAA